MTSSSTAVGGPDLTERDWQPLRGRELSMIFQDPLSALNPCIRVGDQIAEMFRRRAGLGSPGGAADHAVELLARVGIPDADAAARATIPTSSPAACANGS